MRKPGPREFVIADFSKINIKFSNDEFTKAFSEEMKYLKDNGRKLIDSSCFSVSGKNISITGTFDKDKIKRKDIGVYGLCEKSSMASSDSAHEDFKIYDKVNVVYVGTAEMANKFFKKVLQKDPSLLGFSQDARIIGDKVELDKIKKAYEGDCYFYGRRGHPNYFPTIFAVDYMGDVLMCPFQKDFRLGSVSLWENKMHKLEKVADSIVEKGLQKMGFISHGYDGKPGTDIDEEEERE